MTIVAINGYKLHEVEMSLVPYNVHTNSCLKYPEHRIESEAEGDKLLLKIPAFLAIELYRRAILPQNPEQAVSIHVNEKYMGQFEVIDFRYPNSMNYDRDIVSITFHRVAQEIVRTQEVSLPARLVPREDE